MEWQEELSALKREAVQNLKTSSAPAELEELRVKYLGKKGLVTGYLKKIKEIPGEQRPEFGKLVNEARVEVENAYEEMKLVMVSREKELAYQAEKIDVSMPGLDISVGHRHVLMRTQEEIEEIFAALGYAIAEGPEVEYEYFNFETLNIPKDHPARDMQDSFYISDEVVLRTHTSPVQIRYMQGHAPQLPVKIIAPGRVYRRDDDVTHSPVFHQVEGLLVDKGVSFADLKGTLLHFAKRMFGDSARIRLRPSYFPFTEPSAEVDVSCSICGGDGCNICKGTGWLEILGAGMVHPKVLVNGGYDPNEVNGFAFGMGIERIAMLKYGIDDMRLLYQNDVRFLKQF